ncbi:hypothetical protein KY289_013058 [Solanum tuberosum]|nr:hypothetical protein KY289_013058 [Solanum tuberosum]
MAEIGKALTGYVVGVIVLAFALFASAERIANDATSDDFESGLFNLLLHKAKIHYQHFWPDLEFGWRVIVGSVIGFFAVVFGSLGDDRGDGIFAPMLILIIGFDPKTSTAISVCMITGMITGISGATVLLSHPILEHPIIDSDLALLLTPMLLLGISIGVALNVIFAEWMVIVMLIILIIDGRHLLPPSEYWNTKPYEEDEDSGAEDIMYKLLPRGPRIRNEEVVYMKDFSILIAVTTFCTINFLTRSYHFFGVVMSSGEEVITWKVHQLILYCCCGFLSGIVGGLLGLHGGFILVPLFLQLGILPQVSSTTANFMMIFSSSMSVIQYYLLGHFPVPYALYFVAVTTVAALVGSHVVDEIIRTVNRVSVIIFILSFTIFVSALSLGGVGIADTVQRIKEGQYMGFDNICAYKP